MKNLLYGVFTTLFLFGIGKIIYDTGVESQRKKNESIVINIKKGSIDELRKIFNKVEES
jgi:hypothetical protein